MQQGEIPMKNRMASFTGILCFAFCLAAVSAPLMASQERSLKSIYETGKVRFEPKIVLDDDSTPDDIFFEGYEHTSAIAVDEKGNVYVADYAANHVKKFDAKGAFIKTLGREGQGPGEFNSPYTMAYGSGRLMVWNMRNTCFTTITTEGEHIQTRTLNRLEEGWPTKFRSLPDGRILMETRKSNREDMDNYLVFELRLYSADMEYLKTIYSHTVHNRKFIAKLRRDIPAPFAARVCWEITPDGMIAIGYSGDYEIEIHDPDKGKASSFAHEGDPIKVTAEDKDNFFGGITTSQGGQVTRGAPDYIRDNTEFPKFKPAFNQIMVDSEGNFLISQFGPNPSQDYKSFDAFDPGGRFINRVEILEDGKIPIHGAQIRNGAFWVGTSDQDDQIQIIKYRITQ